MSVFITIVSPKHSIGSGIELIPKEGREGGKGGGGWR